MERLNLCLRLVLTVSLILGSACAPPGGPEESKEDVETTETSALALPGLHGFVIASDKNARLGFAAVGVDGAPVKLWRDCPWEDATCTWTYRNGRLLSDANAQLGIMAPTLADGAALTLGPCQASNAPESCKWIYTRGKFVSEANPLYAISVGTSPTHRSLVRLSRACSDSEADECTFMIQSALLSLKSNPRSIRVPANPVDGTKLQLASGCTRDIPECTWTFRKGLMISDFHPDLKVVANGGDVHGSILRVSTTKCAHNRSLGCGWALRKERITIDEISNLGVGAFGGLVDGAEIRLLQGCGPFPDTVPSECQWLGLTAGPQCGHHWQGACGTTCFEGRRRGDQCIPVEKRTLRCDAHDGSNVTCSGKMGITNFGDWVFEGHAHNSGFPRVDYSMGFVLTAPNRLLQFGDSHDGFLGGTLDSDSRSEDYTRQGVDGRIADNWDLMKDADLDCGIEGSAQIVGTVLDVLGTLSLIAVIGAVVVFVLTPGHSDCHFEATGLVCAGESQQPSL